MKNILITGKNSYIGISFFNWIENDPEKYNIEMISLKDGSWRNQDFSCYDVVFHVAGIAHVPSNQSMENQYLKINRDLTIEVAEQAKRSGVKQFIFMSSIIVYGDSNSSEKEIELDAIPSPSNLYGSSKLQAEEGLTSLKSENFKVVVIRPPMVYGKDSKGNYPRLATLAKKLPIFPDFKNQRSMLHVDNLCEFVKIIIDQERQGIYFPQNQEYVNTTCLVKTIAEINGKSIHTTKLFNPLIRLFFGMGVIKKVFGNLVYCKSMSIYDNINYQIRDFRESIALTEK